MLGACTLLKFAQLARGMTWPLPAPSSSLFKYTTLALNEEPIVQTYCPDTHVISPTASASPAADRRKLGICVGQGRVYHSALNTGAG